MSKRLEEIEKLSKKQLLLSADTAWLIARVKRLQGALKEIIEYDLLCEEAPLSDIMVSIAHKALEGDE